VAWFVGDELEKDEAKLARFEHAPAATSAAASSAAPAIVVELKVEWAPAS
jgi:hypothetical protein